MNAKRRHRRRRRAQVAARHHVHVFSNWHGGMVWVTRFEYTWFSSREWNPF